MQPTRLVSELFLVGLGELLVMHVAGDRVLLGNICADKGRLNIRDRGFLEGVRPAQVAPCEENGITGAICNPGGTEWESLTFLGAHHCEIPTDLSSTRSGLLRSSQAASGDSLFEFVGSVYRGFQLMLENHLLPVCLLTPLRTRKHCMGLAVCDLRMASIPLSAAQQVHEVVRAATDRHLTVDLEDVDMDADEFKRLFGGYMGPNG